MIYLIWDFSTDKQKYDEFAVNTEMTLPHKARILREKIASTVENIQKEELWVHYNMFIHRYVF